MADKDSIVNQIETQAGFYEPGTYANLLSFWGNLNLEDDNLGEKYIALSAVQRGGRNPKKFVIGVLPPSGFPSGRLLDRSASVAAATIPDENVNGDALRASGAEEVSTKQQLENQKLRNDSKAPTKGSKLRSLSAKLQARSAQNIATLRADIQPLAQELIARCAQEGITLVITEGSRTNEAQDKLYAAGNPPPPENATKPFITGAKGGESRHNYGVAFDTLIYKADGKPDPGSKLYNRVGAIGKELGLEWGKEVVPTKPPGQDVGHFQYDGGLSVEQLAAGVPPLPAPPPIRRVVNPDTTQGDWENKGSPARSQSQEQVTKAATTDLNNTELGKKLQDAQRAQILANQQAILRMSVTPPLQMLVNPRSFSVKGEKIVSDGNWGRNGPIIEHWGDQQDKISGSGSVAGFYAISVEDGNGPGITRMARNFSQGYQNFMSLYMLYRNNAGIFVKSSDKSTQLADRTNLSVLGSIYIYYDNILYIGSFDSFNVTEDETKPFTLDYSFEFSVRAAFLLDVPSDQGYTYGLPALQPTYTGQPLSSSTAVSTGVPVGNVKVAGT